MMPKLKNLRPRGNCWSRRSRELFRRGTPRSDVSAGQSLVSCGPTFEDIPFRLMPQGFRIAHSKTSLGERAPMVTLHRLPPVALSVVSTFLVFSLTAAAQKKSPETRNTEPTAQVASKPETQEVTEHEDPLFKGMKYRLVGPFRGGRSLTASGIPGDPTTYYFGSTGGGVWKSTDGALTWKPVFEKETSTGIGS